MECLLSALPLGLRNLPWTQISERMGMLGPKGETRTPACVHLFFPPTSMQQSHYTVFNVNADLPDLIFNMDFNYNAQSN